MSNGKDIFSKILRAGDAYLDRVIAKAKVKVEDSEDDAYYRHSVYKDLSSSTVSAGYQEKSTRLTYNFLKQMATKDSIIAAIIQTRQNQMAAFARPASARYERGFKIKVRNERALLKSIREELFGPDKDGKSVLADQQQDAIVDEVKADNKADKEYSDKERERIAKMELNRRTESEIENITQYILHCGEEEDRPFESLKWDFESFVRAVTRDSLTYDQVAMEKIRDLKGDIHHFVPVDGSTIRYAAPSLKNYKDNQMEGAYDILYPEKELKYLEETNALTLEDSKLENEAYKFVQVIKGKIVRAFTAEELSIGMRNPTTDIYANGYSVSELELLVNLVTSHIFTENYNKSYFTQGFSAKGILHIKAPINRRKLESIRAQWKHMISGNRNSFQTPIFAGMDEVQWIPLTQSHSDMEFNNWMNYLIKIICSTYQIDPSEIGFGMRDGGDSGGSSMSGDNTAEKLSQSKDKGLIPLIKFMESFINTNIMDEMFPNYTFEFIGISDEDRAEALQRQQQEVKFKKTLNEIRAEDNLPPIEGADNLVLDPTYMQWYMQQHPDARKLNLENQYYNADLQNHIAQNFEAYQDGAESGPAGGQVMDNAAGKSDEEKEESVQKSFPIKIEYYGNPNESED